MATSFLHRGRSSPWPATPIRPATRRQIRATGPFTLVLQDDRNGAYGADGVRWSPNTYFQRRTLVSLAVAAASDPEPARRQCAAHEAIFTGAACAVLTEPGWCRRRRWPGRARTAWVPSDFGGCASWGNRRRPVRRRRPREQVPSWAGASTSCPRSTASRAHHSNSGRASASRRARAFAERALTGRRRVKSGTRVTVN